MSWREYKDTNHHYWRLRDGSGREIGQVIETYFGWRRVRSDGNLASEVYETASQAIEAHSQH